MSLKNVWKTKATESQERFAAARVTHMFLEMDTTSGVFCRMPAFDIHTEKLTMYIVDHCPSAPEVPRYHASGPAAIQPHRAPTCPKCRVAWEAFCNWWRSQ